MLMITTGGKLFCDAGGFTVHKELSGAHMSSVWTFIQRILDELSEIGRAGNACVCHF